MNKSRIERPAEKRGHAARLELGKIYADQAKPFAGYILTPSQIASFTPAPLLDTLNEIAIAEAIAKRTKDI